MTGPSHGSLERQLDALGALVQQARAGALSEAVDRLRGLSVAQLAGRAGVPSRAAYPVLSEVHRDLREWAVTEHGKCRDPRVTAMWLRRLADHLDPPEVAA